MSQAPHYLSSYDGNRRNNFTVLRFILAWMVIFDHAFVLQPFPGLSNPAKILFQGSTTTGQLAVDGFFAISGFLVAASFVNRGVLDYALARLFRVLPGLIVCVFLTVFVLGPLITRIPVLEYFSQSQTYEFLQNAWPFQSTFYRLPGVFETNKSAGVNGSLWSIPYEMRCYIALGFLGWLGLFKTKVITNSVVALIIAAYWLSFINPELFDLEHYKSSALLCFYIGVLFFSNRDKILLDGRLAILALLVLCLSFGESWYRYAYPISWVYLLFYLAYRTRYLNLDQTVGDCSYGIYIYAFLVQQLTAQLMPSGTPYTNIVISTVVVVPIALLSWNYVERPALGLKTKYMKYRTERVGKAT